MALATMSDSEEENTSISPESSVGQQRSSIPDIPSAQHLLAITCHEPAYSITSSTPSTPKGALISTPFSCLMLTTLVEALVEPCKVD